MNENPRSDSLERIALEMTSTLGLSDVLSSITRGLVEDFDAAFARIWLLGPGDRCDVCQMADICANRDQCLHLTASAGIYPVSMESTAAFLLVRARSATLP